MLCHFNVSIIYCVWFLYIYFFMLLHLPSSFIFFYSQYLFFPLNCGIAVIRNNVPDHCCLHANKLMLLQFITLNMSAFIKEILNLWFIWLNARNNIIFYYKMFKVIPNPALVWIFKLKLEGKEVKKCHQHKMKIGQSFNHNLYP